MRIRQPAMTASVVVLCFWLLLTSCEGTFTRNTLTISAETTGDSGDIQLAATLPHYRAGRLECTTYYQAQWGSDPGELGLCPASSEAWIRGPYPPVPDEHGGLFVLDKANQRIVRYSKSEAPRIIPLPSSYVLDDVCGYSNRWSNISVSKDRLFLRYLTLQNERFVQRLAVLSLEGQEETSIDLEPYYPLNSPYLNSLLPDRKGGVYVQFVPVGLVHFDEGFRPTFVPLGTKADYGNMVVGWDGNFYTYDLERDIVRNQGADARHIDGEALSWLENVISATSVTSSTHVRLIGVDTGGRLYFSFITYEQDRVAWFLRLSNSGKEGKLAVLTEIDLSSSSLAPDGSLYDIVYDPDSPAVKPRIVRCVFGSD